MRKPKKAVALKAAPPAMLERRRMAKPDPVEQLPFDRMIAVLRYRGLNAEALIAAQRRNLESFLAASESVAHGMQSITDKQMGLFRSGLTQAMEHMTAGQMNGQGNGAADPARALKQVESAVHNVTELADMMAKCNIEAFDAVNRSMMDSIRSFYQMLTDAMLRPTES
jgi:hypothetical protein